MVDTFPHKKPMWNRNGRFVVKNEKNFTSIFEMSTKITALKRRNNGTNNNRPKCTKASISKHLKPHTWQKEAKEKELLPSSTILHPYWLTSKCNGREKCRNLKYWDFWNCLNFWNSIFTLYFIFCVCFYPWTHHNEKTWKLYFWIPKNTITFFAKGSKLCMSFTKLIIFTSHQQVAKKRLPSSFLSPGFKEIS